MKTMYGYEVFEDGVVLNKDGSLKKWSPNGRGYLISRLNWAGKWMTKAHHTVVAEAFLGPRPEGHEVNHIDNNKHNNQLSNLEYLTRRDNRLQMYRDGRDVSGTNNANCKYTEDDIRKVCDMLEQDSPCLASIGRVTGVSKSTVGRVYHKQQWSSISSQYNF